MADEFFNLAKGDTPAESHTRRLQVLEASMQHSLAVMRLSEAELAALYGLDGHVQVGGFAFLEWKAWLGV